MKLTLVFALAAAALLGVVATRQTVEVKGFQQLAQCCDPPPTNPCDPKPSCDDAPGNTGGGGGN